MTRTSPTSLASAIAAVLSLASSCVSAATVPVNICADSGAGSLRGAVQAASSGDTIDLTALSCTTITLTSGEIAIHQSDLTLLGPGPDKLTIDGGGSSAHLNRVFEFIGSGTRTLSGMTITDAKYAPATGYAAGGCIRAEGSLVISNSAVTRCFAVAAEDGIAEGAGVFSSGSVQLINSAVTGNVSVGGPLSGGFGYAGGIFTGGDLTLLYSQVSGNTAINGPSAGGGIITTGNLYMLGSTIANNVADVGAGLIVAQYDVAATILNSTISGNRSTARFAGVLTIATTTIANSTIAFNVSTSNSDRVGIYVGAGSLDLQSSIIALNTSPSGLSDLNAASTVVISGANNIVTQSAVGVPAASACPRMGRLADNGGKTPTHALLPGSPAIDAGNNKTGESGSGFVNDQRGVGFPRTYGTKTDIGAFEFNGVPADDVFTSAFENRCD